MLQESLKEIDSTPKRQRREEISKERYDSLETPKIDKYFRKDPIKINEYNNLEKIINLNLSDEIANYNSNNIEKIISMYDTREIQREIESNRGRRNNPDILDNHFYEQLLQATKEKSKSHSPAYFAQQAVVLAGTPSLELAEALARFQKGIVHERFGVEYLRRFLKQDVELSDEELRRYALKQDIQLDNSQYGHEFKGKYFDTKFNFCLTHDGKLIASVGFDAQEGRMFIHQIQGIRGNGDKLKPLKWERALVSYAVKWAEQQGSQEVAVTSVHNNRWAKMYDHLTMEQGKMLYDVTARRTGFIFMTIFTPGCSMLSVAYNF